MKDFEVYTEPKKDYKRKVHLNGYSLQSRIFLKIMDEQIKLFSRFCPFKAFFIHPATDIGN